jgi:hypothetical protein
VGEFYLGDGTFDKLDGIMPPPDSVPFDLGRNGLGLQFRLRTYIGPFGASCFFDAAATPLIIWMDRRGYRQAAVTRNLQILASIPVELFHRRIRIEPLWGYGKTFDRAQTGRTDLTGSGEKEKVVYHGEIRVDGTAYGLETVLRFGRGLQLREIYTYGDYRIVDRRSKTELMLCSDAISSNEVSDAEKDRLSLGVTLGVVQSWRQDGRREFQIYLGAMCRIGWPGLLLGRTH